MKIKKTDEEHYHVRDDFMDERVNGSQLLAMLSGKDLIGTTPDAVLRLLDEHDIGYETVVGYKTTLGETI
jgi:hypothetical protein